MKPLVFVAGAYISDIENNFEIHCNVHRTLLADNIVVPVTPVISGHLLRAEHLSEVFWKNRDIELLNHCQALFRFNKGDGSAGAQEEEEYMKSINRPVFYLFCDLYNWARTVKMKHTTLRSGNFRSNLTAEIVELEKCHAHFSNELLEEVRRALLKGRHGWDNPGWSEEQIQMKINKHLDGNSSEDLVKAAIYTMFLWNRR